jgi:hypothetical protein
MVIPFGCRGAPHADLAIVNPDHCPHISFIPEKDKNGNTKCQETKGINPSDLFSEVELE